MIKKWMNRKKLKREFQEDYNAQIDQIEHTSFPNYNDEMKLLRVIYYDHDNYVRFYFRMKSKSPRSNGWNDSDINIHFDKNIKLSLVELDRMTNSFEKAMVIAIDMHNSNIVTEYNDELVSRREFNTELDNEIRSNQYFKDLERKLEHRDQEIKSLSNMMMDTNSLLTEQTKTIFDLKEEIRELDIDEIKGTMEILKGGFGSCCVATASRLADGSGRKYCDCGMAMTPEVLAVMRKQGAIA